MEKHCFKVMSLKMKSHYGLPRYTRGSRSLTGCVLFFLSNRSTCWRREKGECFRPSVPGPAPAAVPHASVPRLRASACPSSPKPPRPPRPRHITAAPCPATPTPPAGRPSAKTRRTRKISLPVLAVQAQIRHNPYPIHRFRSLHY